MAGHAYGPVGIQYGLGVEGSGAVLCGTDSSQEQHDRCRLPANQHLGSWLGLTCDKCPKEAAQLQLCTVIDIFIERQIAWMNPSKYNLSIVTFSPYFKKLHSLGATWALTSSWPCGD